MKDSRTKQKASSPKAVAEALRIAAASAVETVRVAAVAAAEAVRVAAETAAKSQKTFSTEEVESICEVAAQRALYSFLTSIDVEATNPVNVRNLRDDLNFLSEQRQGVIAMKKTLRHAALYGIGLAILSILYFLWDIFKAGLHTWFGKL